MGAAHMDFPEHVDTILNRTEWNASTSSHSEPTESNACMLVKHKIKGTWMWTLHIAPWLKLFCPKPAPEKDRDYTLCVWMWTQHIAPWLKLFRPNPVPEKAADYMLCVWMWTQHHVEHHGSNCSSLTQSQRTAVTRCVSECGHNA